MIKKISIFILFIYMGLFIHNQWLAADDNVFPLKLELGVEQSSNPKDFAKTLQLAFIITLLSLAPTILIMLTCFTRIIIVLSFLKRAIAVGSQPSNQIMAGLALFMTIFIMGPVFTQINKEALQPYLNNEITQRIAFDRGMEPLKKFMFKHTREKDIALFVELSHSEKPESFEEVSMTHLIPAFIISELKTAFQMGFVIFLPFLIIDMTVASVLLSMGMMMLPPVIISMPFKVLLFVLVDGWYLVIRSLSHSF